MFARWCVNIIIIIVFNNVVTRSKMLKIGIGSIPVYIAEDYCIFFDVSKLIWNALYNVIYCHGNHQLILKYCFNASITICSSV